MVPKLSWIRATAFYAVGLGFEPQRNHSVLVFLEDSVKSHGCYEYSRKFNYCGCIFFINNFLEHLLALNGRRKRTYGA